MSDFAAYLKESRQAAGLNQSELAALAGLTGSYISVLESRRKPPPSDPVLKKLARALDVPEGKMLEIAHLDRTPVDIRKKIQALDRRVQVERKLSARLLGDLIPSSLWHFWRVRGFHEYGLERLRLDAGKRKVLKKILRRIGHLTARDDFEEQAREALADLPPDELEVLAEVLPELSPADAPKDDDTDTPRTFTARVEDDEMLPRLEEGDLLVVDPDASPETGDLVLVRLGKRDTVRQLTKSGRKLLLHAANPRVSPTEASAEDLRGVVTEVRRSLR